MAVSWVRISRGMWINRPGIRSLTAVIGSILGVSVILVVQCRAPVCLKCVFTVNSLISICRFTWRFTKWTRGFSVVVKCIVHVVDNRQIFHQPAKRRQIVCDELEIERLWVAGALRKRTGSTDAAGMHQWIRHGTAGCGDQRLTCFLCKIDHL